MEINVLHVYLETIYLYNNTVNILIKKMFVVCVQIEGFQECNKECFLKFFTILNSTVICFGLRLSKQT